MYPPRDSKGRFTKRTASVSPGTGAVSPCKPCKKKQPKASTVVETEKIYQNFQDQYESLIKKHEAQVSAMVNKYEQSLSSINNALERVAAQHAQSLQMPPPPAPAPPPAPEVKPSGPSPTPSAIWIKAPDGENLMLINQAAAVMFLAIFERTQEVTREFQKMLNPNAKIR